MLSEIQIKDRIRKIRVDKDISQSDFAKMLNLSQGAYSSLEKGNTELSIDKVNKIASALGVSVQYLLFGDEQSSQSDSEKDKKIRELESKEYLLISAINSILESFASSMLLGLALQEVGILSQLLEKSEEELLKIDFSNEDKAFLAVEKAKKDWERNNISSKYDRAILAIFTPLESIDIGFYIKEKLITNPMIVNAFNYYKNKIFTNNISIMKP